MGRSSGSSGLGAPCTHHTTSSVTAARQARTRKRNREFIPEIRSLAPTGRTLAIVPLGPWLVASGNQAQRWASTVSLSEFAPPAKPRLRAGEGKTWRKSGSGRMVRFGRVPAHYEVAAVCLSTWIM